VTRAPSPDPDLAPRPADVIVVAAGQSTRMRGRDKLEIALAGRPLLAWTLDAFARRELIEHIVLVVSPERIAHWRAVDWLPAEVSSVVAGGPRRQDSVAAGVAHLAGMGMADDRVVLVHDGARPAVGVGLIQRVIEAAAEHGAAIPVLPIADTLKRVDGDLVFGGVDRVGLAGAQTPQGFRFDLLREAFVRFPAGSVETFTDEAALMEACSIPVHAIRGSADNVKVTLPTDLGLAEAALHVPRPRVGFGHDGHRFGPGEPLVLGGLVFPGAPRLHGHSDGDVVLHATADALLGAAGLGDLGRLFPADERTPRDVDSAKLLTEIVRQITTHGYRPRHVDVTIVGARPQLGSRLEEMRTRIAEILGQEVEGVSVKASTGNLEGMEGAGRGISARVVAVVAAGAE
jgi:2-C-methyl-D-erythritol 4-phosphate cytidylyltransferase/2-C-methyl-D-erythritol 2,4-cyclodiphosphate synthase